VEDGKLSVRFEPGLMAAAEKMAAEQNMTLSAWIRHAVREKILRSSDTCPACGRALEQDSG